MANSVDKRIVEMQFDNSRFEKNVNQSISTLDRLKEKLDFSKSTKGFESLEKEANSINFSGLEHSIANIEKRFSALGIAGATVISTLTQKAMGAVGKLNSAVFGQMKSGGISRALNLEHANFMLQGILKDANKVAEIMSSDGPVQKSVKGTAYGLDAAANAAAQFVASGIKDTKKLETALTAISGAAAISGSSYEEMSRIFTKVAASGRMMGDTVVEMSTRGINALATLSEQLDIPVEKLQEMQKKGQISFEMFSDAMNKAFGEQAKKANETFTGALSNVKAALSRIGAKVAAPTIENLRVIFVKLITVIDNASKALQPLIDFINNTFFAISKGIAMFLSDANSIDKIITNIVQTIGNGIKIVYSFILPIKRALEEFIPAKTVNDAITLTEKIKEFSKTLILTAEQMVTVRRIFQGVFGVFDLAVQIISALVRVLFPAANGIKDFIGGFADGAATIGDYIYAIAKVCKETDAFYQLFSLIKDIVGEGLAYITGKLTGFSSAFEALSGIKFVGGSFVDGIKNLVDSFKNNAAPFETAGNIFVSVFKGLQDVITAVSPLFGSFVGLIGRSLGELANGFEQVFNGGGFRTLMTLIGSGLLVTLAVDLAYFINTIVGTFSRGIGIINSIKSVLFQLTNTLKVTQTKIKSEALLNLAKAIGILVASIVALSMLDSGAAARSIAMITLLMGELLGLTYLIEKFSKTWQSNAALLSAAGMFMGLAVAVFILAGAMKQVASIPSEQLSDTLGVVSVLLLELTGVAIALSATEAKIKAGAMTLIGLSAAVKILASAMNQIANIPSEKLMDSLGVVTALILELTAVTLALSLTEAKLQTGAIALIGLAASVKILAGAMQVIGSIPSEQITQALIGLSVALVGIAAAAALIGATDFGFFQGGGVLMMAAGLKILAGALTELSTIPDESIGNTIGLFGALVGTLAVFALIGNFVPNMLLTGAALVTMAIGINILVPALVAFQAVADSGYTALVALGGALLLMGAAAAAFGAGIQIIGLGALGIAAVSAACLIGAAAIAATAVAIEFISDAFERLGTVDWGTILSGLGKFAVIAISLGAMGALIAPLAITMTILAAAIGMISLACIGLAASITIAAFGVTTMAAAIQSFENVSPEAIAKAIDVLNQTLLALVNAAWLLAPITPIVVILGAGILALGVGALAAASSLILFAQAFEMLAPIVQQVGPALEDFCQNFGTYFKQMLDEIWNSLVSWGALLTQLLNELLAGLLKLIINGFKNMINNLVDLGAQLLESLGVPKKWADAGADLIKGFIQGIADNISGAVDKVKDLGNDIIKGLKDVLQIHSPSEVADEIGGLFDEGLGNGVIRLKDWVVSRVASVGEGMIEQAKSDANKVMDVWEAAITYYGRSLEFDVGLNNGDWGYRGAGVGYQNKSGELKNLISGNTARPNLDTIQQETSAINSNTGAVGKNSAAKAKNEEANEGKTDAIGEETEATSEEEGAVEDNTEAMYAMAEEISVVTEEYKRLYSYRGLAKKMYAAESKYLSNASKIWTKTFKSIGAISKQYSQLVKTVPTFFTKKDQKQMYQIFKPFEENASIKKAKGVKNNIKSITKAVMDQGKIIAKVNESTITTYRKVGNEMHKLTFNGVKNTKKMTNILKAYQKALNNRMPENSWGMIERYQEYQEVLYDLRRFEENFGAVAYKDLTKGNQNYLKALRDKLVDVEKPMQHLSKQLGGTYELFDKNNKAMAATIDGFITLGASLYEGSEAANEYATEIAQLEFLASLPEPLIGWDVVEAAKIDYLTRMKDALIEYKQQLDETYASEIDMFTAFNKNKLEDGTNVIQTLMSNIAGYYNYGEMLNELARRLPIATESATNLVKQFAEGGIDNYGKLEAVLKLSNKELNAFIYGYGILTKTQEELSSKAMAAVANASSYSSRRQQAMAQDVNKKTTKYSAQVRKAIEADMHAVAYATIEYGEVFKIEEKKYLKTLSEIDKEQYKKVKKELARGKKYYNEQVKLLKKQEKIEKKLGDVKNYKGLNKLLLTYSKTTPGLMKKINEQIKETITGIDKVTKLNRKNDLKLIHFGKVLGAEGENFEELMESIAEKINEWRDGIKGAINDTKNLYTEFKHVSSGINADTMISNFVSRFNALGNAFNAGIAQLPSLGYNSSVIKYIGDLFASDQDAAFDQLQALLGASAEQIKVFNQASKRLEESGTAASAAATKAALQADNEVYEREWKDAKDTYEAGMNNVAENYDALSESINGQKDAVTNQLTAIRKTLKSAKDANEIAKLQAQEAKLEAQYSALITQEASVLANRAKDEAQLAKLKSDAYWKYKNYKDQLEAATKDADKQIEYEIEYQAAMNNVSVYEQLTGAVEKYAKTLSTDLVRGYAGVAEAEANANQKKADAKAKYDQEIQSAVVLEERLKAINIELEQEQKQLVGLKAKLATTTKKKDRDKILSQINALNQSIKAYEKEAQTVEANAAAKRTTAEKNLDKAIKAAEEEVEAVRKVQASYDAAYDSDVDYQNKSMSVMKKVTRKLTESLNKVSEAVALAKKRFSQFEGQTNITAYSITMIEEGFLKLASTLDAVNDESSDFLDNMGKRLENYRKTLYDTIKGQVNLFEEFKKFSGDEATGASTYIKNMESQINGVKEWLTNLEKLADRGVAKEVIQMFAEEGQASFEKVAAFANATEEELAALNYRYKEYLDLMEGTNNVAAAADRALATVGAAFSSAAERMQQQILSKFRESTGTEIEKAAYEGAVMVVTGVKDGLTNASPQIIAEVEGVATQISDTMAKTLNASAIEESIRTGLQTMSGAIQNTVGAIVVEFLDSVTTTSVNKFKMAVDSCRAYVEQTLPKEYTIKIRVDASDMDAAIARMNAAIYNTNFVAAQTSSAVTSSQANQAPVQQVQTQAPAANNTTVNYTQNNYSPKTLSRAEIYRQTQNQLSQINSYLATIAGSSANP